MGEDIKILWTKSGCVKCEDYRNAGLYNQLTDLEELSLNDAEGLSLAFFHEMTNKKGDLETPCLYIGSKYFYSPGAQRYIGDEVEIYLRGLKDE